MLHKINFEMVVLFVLMVLALTIIAIVVVSNSGQIFAASEIGDFVGACASTCTSGGT